MAEPQPWFHQPLPDEINFQHVVGALAQGQAQNEAVLQHMAQILAGLPVNQQQGPAVKKYIATPESFDGQAKHWKTFRNQINTYIQANESALTSDEDRNWLVMSYLKEGTALEYTQLILKHVNTNI